MEQKEQKKTILIVDDEALVLRAGQRMLDRLGYRVLVAESGEEACRIYSSEKDQIDLIILDLSMPDMDGTDTFFKLHEIDKNVQVVVSSGFDKENRLALLLENGALGFVQKPFDLKTLGKELSCFKPLK